MMGDYPDSDDDFDDEFPPLMSHHRNVVSPVQELSSDDVHNATKNDYDSTAPRLRKQCCENDGQLQVAKLLMEHGTDEAKSLHWACFYGYLVILGFLLDNGANVNSVYESSDTPLLKKACNNTKEAGITLPANANVESALSWACYKGHLEIVQWIIENNISGVNDKLLLRRGANIMSITDDSNRDGTPLQVACRENHPNVVWFLVREFLVEELLE